MKIWLHTRKLLSHRKRVFTLFWDDLTLNYDFEFWHENMIFDIEIWIWHRNINFDLVNLESNLTWKYDFSIIWHEKYSTTTFQTLPPSAKWSTKDVYPLMSRPYMEPTMVPPQYIMETLRHPPWYTKDLPHPDLLSGPPKMRSVGVDLTRILI